MTLEPKSLPLSVVIVTNRCDQRLKACLDSVSWAEEILVFDDYSGGEWNEIKKGRSFKYALLEKPLSNFAETRNWALSQATHEWVFLIDSDEVVTRESQVVIKSIIESDVDAATVKRTDIFYGKRLEWGEVRDVKLLRLGRKKRLRFERPVHEVAVGLGKIIESNVEILHYSHPTISDFWRSITQHARRDAEYRVAQSESFSLIQMLGYPLAKALYNTFFKLGLLDGWRGITYIILMSCHSLCVRVFMYEKTSH